MVWQFQNLDTPRGGGIPQALGYTLTVLGVLAGVGGAIDVAALGARVQSRANAARLVLAHELGGHEQSVGLSRRQYYKGQATCMPRECVFIVFVNVETSYTILVRKIIHAIGANDQINLTAPQERSTRTGN